VVYIVIYMILDR